MGSSEFVSRYTAHVIRSTGCVPGGVVTASVGSPGVPEAELGPDGVVFGAALPHADASRTNAPIAIQKRLGTGSHPLRSEGSIVGERAQPVMRSSGQRRRVRCAYTACPSGRRAAGERSGLRREVVAMAGDLAVCTFDPKL